ncbi:OmpP1/FadL family transporter [Dawidia soli]|uniref:Uncharacterized protein n=1 Tax=Dawidia soli TaxID=2782352 RepID=A0AAP2GDX2_9BACT|nr:hypothetical protein [Dawidia soli]MBT1687742.1 hypothetical protein [Dawidia soli]
MKVMKVVRIALTVAILLFIISPALPVLGQSFTGNALLFSRTKPAGSARIQALGGTQTSLGGDFSSAASNPAGLGFYTKSEFTLGLGVAGEDISTNYYGTTSSNQNSKFNIPSLSLVLHYGNNRETGFLGGSFAITFTRINDLNNSYRYRGTNNETSIIDFFVDDAYFQAPDDPAYLEAGNDGYYTLSGLAYNNYLVDAIYDDNGRFTGRYGSVLDTDIPIEGQPDEVRTIDQVESFRRSGRQYQWSFAYGANFSDKFYLGASLGLTTLRYSLELNFRESNFRYTRGDQTVDYNPLDYHSTTENIDIEGSGANFTIGAIYKPVNFVQLGVSLATPTWYSLTDNYTASQEANWNNFDYYDTPDDDSDDLRNIVSRFDSPTLSEYTLRTPMKVSAGATFIAKFGFITADVEFVNYGNSKYKDNTGNSDWYDSDNKNIKSTYTSVVNYRVGAEYRYNIFRARLGYNLMADPYRASSGVDRKIQSVSGGVGVRVKKFYTDLAVVSSKTENVRVPYSVDDIPEPRAIQDVKNMNYLLTLGFTF